jgi:hypothetical protein
MSYNFSWHTRNFLQQQPSVPWRGCCTRAYAYGTSVLRLRVFHSPCFLSFLPPTFVWVRPVQSPLVSVSSATVPIPKSSRPAQRSCSSRLHHQLSPPQLPGTFLLQLPSQVRNPSGRPPHTGPGRRPSKETGPRRRNYVADKGWAAPVSRGAGRGRGSRVRATDYWRGVAPN